MHIQEGTNTTLTTCTKMTEEVDRRHGVNGNSSSKASVSEDVPVHNSALNATGGRLKFFKDGKFILELVRGCAREGERAGWVSVPRKTFWPPAAAATPPAPAAASLSASDDNSSVHSSPWQRDHCWKQAAPRKNVSKQLAMYYCRPSSLPAAAVAAGARLKRRRPHDAADPARERDAADREIYHHIKLKKPYQYRKLRAYRKTAPVGRRGTLARAIAKLTERAPSAPPVNAKLASCRQEHAMVSPRKRILRELERVSLEDQGAKRRARTAPALSTASYPAAPASAPAPNPAAGPSRAQPAAANGAPARREGTAGAGKHVGSYSIQSLLSMRDSSPARSLRTASPASVTSPEPSGSPAGSSPPAYCARWPAYRGPAYREEWPAYHYPYPYVAAHVYRAPPAPLWMHYSLPPAPAPAPAPWPPLPLPLLTDRMPNDEHASDLPLNLSKH